VKISAIISRYYKSINLIEEEASPLHTFPQFAVYIVVLSLDDGRNCRPKHVAYV